MTRRAELMERLRKVNGLQIREAVERQIWSRLRASQSRVFIGKEVEEALETERDPLPHIQDQGEPSDRLITPGGAGRVDMTPVSSWK